VTGVISLAMLQALEVDPDPLSIPPCPVPLERLDPGPPAPERPWVWTLATRLFRRRR
jgi:hypothetical protein